MAYLVPDTGKPGETIKVRVKDAKYIGTGPTVYRGCVNKNLTSDERNLANRSIRVIPLSIKHVPPNEYKFDIEISPNAKAFEYDITLAPGGNVVLGINAGIFKIDTPIKPLTSIPTSPAPIGSPPPPVKITNPIPVKTPVTVAKIPVMPASSTPATSSTTSTTPVTGSVATSTGISESIVRILEAEASILEALSKEAAKRITDADWLRAAAEKECCAAKLIEALDLDDGDIITAGPTQPQPIAGQPQQPIVTRSMGDYKIIKIEGIGKAYEKRFNEVGIETTGDLLLRTMKPSMREDLAEEIGISPKLILEWVKRADLMRIGGVGEEWSDLLELVGVNSVEELSMRDPEDLYMAIVEFDKKGVVRKTPAKDQISAWVAQAKNLEWVLEY